MPAGKYDTKTLRDDIFLIYKFVLSLTIPMISYDNHYVYAYIN